MLCCHVDVVMYVFVTTFSNCGLLRNRDRAAKRVCHVMSTVTQSRYTVIAEIFERVNISYSCVDNWISVVRCVLRNISFRFWACGAVAIGREFNGFSMFTFPRNYLYQLKVGHRTFQTWKFHEEIPFTGRETAFKLSNLTRPGVRWIVLNADTCLCLSTTHFRYR